MRQWFVAGCAFAFVAVPVAAAAQDAGDDWGFVEDAGRGVVAAMVSYDGGQAIVTQCQGGELNVLLLGLPNAETHYVHASRADGRTDIQSWSSAPDQRTTFRASHPGRDLRFMRGGGTFEIRSYDGVTTPIRASYDLPTQSANVDRVLAACGWPSTDERDAIPLYDGPIFTARAPARSNARSSRIPVSCLVRNSRTQDCRPDRIRPGMEETDAQAAEHEDGDELQFGRPGNPAPDGVIYTTVSVPNQR